MLARRGPLFVYLGAGFLTAAGIWYCLTSNVSSTIQHHHFPQIPKPATGLEQPSPQPNSSIVDTLSNDLLHVQYQPSTMLLLNHLLNFVLADAALQFRPLSENVKDHDLAYIARQTVVLNNLLTIHKSLDPSPIFDIERTAFRHTIEMLQQSLYPWIVKIKDNLRTPYTSFFDLIESYDQDVGIVICLGKETGFRTAIHQIVTLREVLKSTLPIEVFYAGDEALRKRFRTFITGLAASYGPNSAPIILRDITEYFPDPDELLGLTGEGSTRPFAMLASSFRQVIMTGPDTIFVQDPRILLHEPTYLEYGSIFWHDRIFEPGPDENYDWAEEVLNRAKVKNLDRVKAEGVAWFTRKGIWELENGALVIDKSRNLAGLLMTCHMNTKLIREEITNVMLFGDAASHWYAHALTNTPYHFVPGYSGGIGQITPQTQNADREHICTSRLLHVLETTGQPFWFSSSLLEFMLNNDMKYVVPTGWVGHDASWYSDPAASRLSQNCVRVPSSSTAKLQQMAEEIEEAGGKVDSIKQEWAPVNRVDGELKARLEHMIKVAIVYDRKMVKDGLVEIEGLDRATMLTEG